MKKGKMFAKVLLALFVAVFAISCSQAVGGLGGSDLAVSDSSKASYSGSDLVGCVLSFEGNNGLFVVSETKTTNAPLQCDRSKVGTWEKFTVVDAGDGNIAFRAYNGKYVCADRNYTGTPLLANRTAIGSWETFEFIDLGNGTCSIYSPYFNKYWKISGSTSDDNTLTAGANTVWSNSTFGYTIESGTPSDDSGSTGEYPSDIIPSIPENWKLTLPIDEDGNDSSDASSVDDRNTDPWEIALDDLVDFEYAPYFTANSTGTGVQFRAHCAGATTDGSDYPRSELRQEYNGGDNYWDMDDYQKLNTRLKVTHVPVEKPEISITQIHGPENEPLRVQYHAEDGMYVVWNESNKDYDTGLDYSLGDIVEITVEVTGGQVYLTIENDANGNTYTKDWASNDDTGYFKVGAYTQSSIFLSEIKGDDYNDESDSAYGEVVVYTINLTEN